MDTTSGASWPVTSGRCSSVTATLWIGRRAAGGSCSSICPQPSRRRLRCSPRTVWIVGSELSGGIPIIRHRPSHRVPTPMNLPQSRRKSPRPSALKLARSGGSINLRKLSATPRFVEAGGHAGGGAVCQGLVRRVRCRSLNPTGGNLFGGRLHRFRDDHF